MRPPACATALCILAWMALSVAISNSPRASPDWLVATTTRQPSRVSRAIASRLPGMGFHSSGDLMNWSESKLMTPSRSRMMSFMGEILRRQPRQVRNPVHGPVQLAQERQPVGFQGRIVGVDHHVIEEGVDRCLEGGKRLQRSGVIACFKSGIGTWCNLAERGKQRLFRFLYKTRRIGCVPYLALGLLQDVADALVGGGKAFRLGQCSKRAYSVQ